jgi:hypothetical protein
MRFSTPAEVAGLDVVLLLRRNYVTTVRHSIGRTVREDGQKSGLVLSVYFVVRDGFAVDRPAQ